MSCCGSSSYCNFEFPVGPPLTDNSVTSLNATYLFLPYGTLLAKGELIRIWTENGKTQEVLLEEKYAIDVLPAGPEVEGDKFPLPWQLIALDSGMEYDDLMDWYHHPLHQADQPTAVLKFRHPPKPKKSIKQILHAWLYKLRNL